MADLPKTPRLFFPRIGAAFIDLSLIYALTVVMRALIWTLTYLPFDFIFISVFFLYFLFLHAFRRTSTIGETLVGLSVRMRDGSMPSLGRWLIREGLAKTLLGICMAGYGIGLLFPVWANAVNIIFFLLIILFALLGILIFRRPWWERLSGTVMVRSMATRKEKKRSFLVFSGATVIALLIIWWPLRQGTAVAHDKFFPEYPATARTRTEADWLKAHGQDPVDYMLGLFRTHDIVVFSERLHPEYTQYRLLMKLVSDPRFIHEVGCIMTECGSISFQDTVNTYLRTVYPDQASLDRATADLQRSSNGVWPNWNNTNLYDWFETVNKLNAGLPDSLKIHWHFTDLAVDWRVMDHAKFDAAYRDPLRDSMMAQSVLDCYRYHLPLRHHRKALVIMNTRHGYGKCRADNPKYTEKAIGTAAYLQDSLPGKVATVLVNHGGIKYAYMFEPIADGRWDKAFAMNGNKPVGFDLKGSPFGDDPFDLAFMSGKGVKFHHMFDGMVFYEPFESHFRRQGVPYMFEGSYADTMIRRAAIVSPDYQQGVRNEVAVSRSDPARQVEDGPMNTALYHNLFFMAVLPFLMLVAVGIGGILGFRIPDSGIADP